MPKLLARGLTQDQFEALVFEQQRGPLIPAARAVETPPPLKIISGIFVVLFMAYLIMQNFMTTVLPGSDGYWALATLYAVFLVFLNISGPITQILGIKAALGVSAATYTTLHVVVALAATAQENSKVAFVPPLWALLATSGLCGAGASVLWTAQGAYCSAIAQHFPGTTVVQTQSYFFTAFSVNGVLGFLGVLLLFQGAGISEANLLWCAAALSLAGVLSFLALPNLVIKLGTALAATDRPGDAAQSSAPRAGVTATLPAAQGADQIIDRGGIEPDNGGGSGGPGGAADTKSGSGVSGGGFTKALRNAGRMLELYGHANVALAGVTFFQLGCQAGLYWGVVADRMPPALIAASFILHGVASTAAGALAQLSVFSSEKGGALAMSVASKSAFFVATSVLGCCLAAIALHPSHGSGSDESDNEEVATKARREAFLFIGTGLFGFSDFTTQALVRGAVASTFEGTVYLEACMANVQFSVTAGIAFNLAVGPLVEGWLLAVAVSGLGIASMAYIAVRAGLSAVRCDDVVGESSVWVRR